MSWPCRVSFLVFLLVVVLRDGGLVVAFLGAGATHAVCRSETLFMLCIRSSRYLQWVLDVCLPQLAPARFWRRCSAATDWPWWISCWRTRSWRSGSTPWSCCPPCSSTRRCVLCVLCCGGGGVGLGLSSPLFFQQEAAALAAKHACSQGPSYAERDTEIVSSAGYIRSKLCLLKRRYVFGREIHRRRDSFAF